ncbi:MAG: imidazole glycerol phosphate synthase subunit HisH [Paracoccaceae bacterium]
MLTALIDYDSGNLHSAAKAFQKMAAEVDGGEIIVTSDADVVARADRLVLPGDGAFPACMRALRSSGVLDALTEAVTQRAVPFMGICVGMQLMAHKGYEYETIDGLGWIDGTVRKITPADPALKVPHMGWNDLNIDGAHPVLDGVSTGDHAYFVHSYHMQVAQADQRLAHVDYAGDVTAIVARDTRIGLQFHPEKSSQTGLRMIANFLRWRP